MRHVALELGLQFLFAIASSGLMQLFLSLQFGTLVFVPPLCYFGSLYWVFVLISSSGMMILHQNHRCQKQKVLKEYAENDSHFGSSLIHSKCSCFQKSAISNYSIRIYAPSRRKYPQILLFISLQVKNWQHILWRRLIRSRACKCLAIQ